MISACVYDLVTTKRVGWWVGGLDSKLIFVLERWQVSCRIEVNMEICYKDGWIQSLVG